MVWLGSHTHKLTTPLAPYGTPPNGSHFRMRSRAMAGSAHAAARQDFFFSRWTNSRLSALITAFVGLQSIDDFQIKRTDYCLCRPSLCSQNLVDRNSTNSGLSVSAGLSACFSYFLPKQFNNVFFTPDFLHGARSKKLAFLVHYQKRA
jgi:hypothetical protein